MSQKPADTLTFRSEGERHKEVCSETEREFVCGRDSKRKGEGSEIQRSVKGVSLMEKNKVEVRKQNNV